MSTLPIVRTNSGYVITQKGIDALADPRHCECQPVLEGLLFKCMLCGTIWWKYSSEEHRS